MRPQVLSLVLLLLLLLLLQLLEFMRLLRLLFGLFEKDDFLLNFLCLIPYFLQLAGQVAPMVIPFPFVHLLKVP